MRPRSPPTTSAAASTTATGPLPTRSSLGRRRTWSTPRGSRCTKVAARCLNPFGRHPDGLEALVGHQPRPARGMSAHVLAGRVVYLDSGRLPRPAMAGSERRGFDDLSIAGRAAIRFEDHVRARYTARVKP